MTKNFIKKNQNSEFTEHLTNDFLWSSFLFESSAGIKHFYITEIGEIAGQSCLFQMKAV